MDITEFDDLINTLQKSGENERIEAKQTARTIGKSVLSTISAFSNEPGMGGGYLVLGLTKNTAEESPYYEVTGIKDSEQAQSEVVTLCRQCFNIPIRPSLELRSYQDRQFLLVYIPEAEPHDKPVYIQSDGIEKGTFRRIGPTDQLCTKKDLDYLFQQRSRKKYDETLVEHASFEDFDPQAIEEYRQLRKEVYAAAEELKYSDEELLQSLALWVPSRGGGHPTVAGLVLFGKPLALRRLFPMSTRVDYILIDGRDWVPDPEKRYHTVENREALVTMIPRLIRNIMTDIPQAFVLSDEGIHRKDHPTIPRKAIREAVCNALMHRDYTCNQPVQIRRYANRIEFANAGYSLKPEEELGLPGSITRNDKIAAVLHEINVAETKGTGIRTMRDLMRGANLTVPLIESDRGTNQFTLTFLTHHLFDKQDIEWLKFFKDYNLSDEDAHTLIVVREMGAITNADYRTINGVDTLVASAQLRRLRDLELLEQKGKGNATYYVPTQKMLFPEQILHTSPLSGGVAPHTSPLSEGVAPHTSPLSEGVAPHVSSLSEDLREIIRKVGKRAPPSTIKSVIKRLCSSRPFKPSEIALLLQRNQRYMRDHYLTPMVKAGELELGFPDNPAHFQQSYQAKKT
jgi:ATP-dependent DNA helicase RecG